MADHSPRPGPEARLLAGPVSVWPPGHAQGDPDVLERGRIISLVEAIGAGTAAPPAGTE